MRGLLHKEVNAKMKFAVLFVVDVRFGAVLSIIEPRHKKINVLVTDMVQHKPGCTATEAG